MALVGGCSEVIACGVTSPPKRARARHQAPVQGAAERLPGVGQWVGDERRGGAAGRALAAQMRARAAGALGHLAKLLVLEGLGRSYTACARALTHKTTLTQGASGRKGASRRRVVRRAHALHKRCQVCVAQHQLSRGQRDAVVQADVHPCEHGGIQGLGLGAWRVGNGSGGHTLAQTRPPTRPCPTHPITHPPVKKGLSPSSPASASTASSRAWLCSLGASLPSPCGARQQGWWWWGWRRHGGGGKRVRLVGGQGRRVRGKCAQAPHPSQPHLPIRSLPERASLPGHQHPHESARRAECALEHAPKHRHVALRGRGCSSSSKRRDSRRAGCPASARPRACPPTS